jgi:hypothetical protein
MAYSFDGSNQALTTTSSPVTATPLTMFVRLNAASTGSKRLFAIKRTSTNDRFAIIQSGASFPATVDFTVQEPPSNAFAFLSAVLAQNTWAGVTGLSANDSSRFVFFNTTKSTENTTTRTPLPTSLEVRIGGDASFFDGLLAEAAIWNAALTDDEVASLAQGFKPSRVRPQSLQFYAPIVRELRDLRGGLTLTNNNTATVADHPRVY